MRCEHVKSLPYVGEDYKKETPWGLPILIVGESHYTRDHEQLYPEFTTEVVRATLGGESKHPSSIARHWEAFFTKTVGLFNGCWPNQEVRRQFWRFAAFYNFVQETVGNGPRIRPTDEMWRKAGPAFQEVLIEYKPGFVLVLGKQLWAHMPLRLDGPVVRLPDGQSGESRLYSNDAGYTLAFGIDHPSSRGWSYAKWTPWVQSALSEALKFQRK